MTLSPTEEHTLIAWIESSQRIANVDKCPKSETKHRFFVGFEQGQTSRSASSVGEASNIITRVSLTSSTASDRNLLETRSLPAILSFISEMS
jgi:hypothetical protein